MFVGGEFYNDTRWLSDKPTISTSNMTFLNGGKACLVVIGEYLLDHGIKRFYCLPICVRRLLQHWNIVGFPVNTIKSILIFPLTWMT